jgi:hypothetical protein
MKRLAEAVGIRPKTELDIALQKRRMEAALREQGLSRRETMRAISAAFAKIDKGGKP